MRPSTFSCGPTCTAEGGASKPPPAGSGGRAADGSQPSSAKPPCPPSTTGRTGRAGRAGRAAGAPPEASAGAPKAAAMLCSRQGSGHGGGSGFAVQHAATIVQTAGVACRAVRRLHTLQARAASLTAIRSSGFAPSASAAAAADLRPLPPLRCGRARGSSLPWLPLGCASSHSLAALARLPRPPPPPPRPPPPPPRLPPPPSSASVL